MYDTTTFSALTPFFCVSRPSCTDLRFSPTILGSGLGTIVPFFNALGRNSRQILGPTSFEKIAVAPTDTTHQHTNQRMNCWIRLTSFHPHTARDPLLRHSSHRHHNRLAFTPIHNPRSRLRTTFTHSMIGADHRLPVQPLHNLVLHILSPVIERRRCTKSFHIIKIILRTCRDDFHARCDSELECTGSNAGAAAPD